jgi:hypothetical protein
MEEKEQPLSEEMLFRVLKVAEILAKSTDIDVRLIKKSLIQNDSTSKINDGLPIWDKKTRS